MAISIRMVQLYVLKLTNGKVFVGSSAPSNDVHLFGTGYSWTTMYKPIGILQIINNCNDDDIDNYTILYMKKYGIDNVRGGSYSDVFFSDAMRSNLYYELYGKLANYNDNSSTIPWQTNENEENSNFNNINAQYFNNSFSNRYEQVNNRKRRIGCQQSFDNENLGFSIDCYHSMQPDRILCNDGPWKKIRKEPTHL